MQAKAKEVANVQKAAARATKEQRRAEIYAVPPWVERADIGSISRGTVEKVELFDAPPQGGAALSNPAMKPMTVRCGSAHFQPLANRRRVHPTHHNITVGRHSCESKILSVVPQKPSLSPPKHTL